MKNRTISVTMSADRDAVFAFLSRTENLSRWLPSFCADLRREGAHWRALTPAGEFFVALVADAHTGVIDLLLGEERDQMAVLPLRVVRLPRGAAVLATLFQPADWADELFERCYDGLLAGLRGLAARNQKGELWATEAGSEPFYPSLVTAKFIETWDFYAAQLGFRTVCESNVYVHLAHACGAQLGLLRHEVDGVPSEFVSATSGRGFWLNLNVADADAEHARLSAAGVEVVEAPEDKPWGHRQFIVRDPNGVLISVAHKLPTSVTEPEVVAAS